MKKYFLFFESRHYGYSIKFISKEEALELTEDEDNTDLPCCFVYRESQEVAWLPSPVEYDTYSFQVNIIPTRAEKSQKFFIKVALDNAEIGSSFYV
jgi:hypothetical protein